MSMNCSDEEAFQIINKFVTILHESGAHEIMNAKKRTGMFGGKFETVIRCIEKFMNPRNIFIQTEVLERTREFLMGTVSTSNSNSNSNSPIQILSDDLVWMVLEHIRAHALKTPPMQYQRHKGQICTYYGDGKYKMLKCVQQHDHHEVAFELEFIHHKEVPQNQIKFLIYYNDKNKIPCSEQLDIHYYREPLLPFPLQKINYRDAFNRKRSDKVVVKLCVPSHLTPEIMKDWTLHAFINTCYVYCE